MGALQGTYKVICNNGHVDTVDGITEDHDCEKCGQQSVGSGSANILCGPNDHKNWVEGVTTGHKCGVCGAECNLDN